MIDKPDKRYTMDEHVTLTSQSDLQCIKYSCNEPINQLLLRRVTRNS